MDGTQILTDELFHPLIDAMVAADVPAPNLREDIVKDGRVVGMVEFGGRWRKLPFPKKKSRIKIFALFSLSRVKPS